MSLFGRKSKSEETKKIDELTALCESLKKENAAIKAQTQKELKQYSEKLSAANAEIYRLNKKAAKAGKKNRGDEQVGADNADKKVEKQAEKAAEKFAENSVENELLSRYRLEIKRLKQFIAVWERALLSDGVSENKSRRAALARALKEILSFNEQECSLAELSDKVAYLTDFVSGGKREEEGGIDLDEVLNPSVELNLEELCKELGVME